MNCPRGHTNTVISEHGYKLCLACGWTDGTDGIFPFEELMTMTVGVGPSEERLGRMLAEDVKERISWAHRRKG